MALWLLWLQNGREEQQLTSNSRWICKLYAHISKAQACNMIFVVPNYLICSNTLRSANSTLSFSNFHRSKQFNLQLSPCVSLIYSYVLVWKGENRGPVSFRMEVRVLPVEKSALLYHNFCHLYSLRDPLRNSQGYSTDRGREFLKAISTFNNVCEYWILLFPLWFYDYCRFFKKQTEKAIYCLGLFCFLNL